MRWCMMASWMYVVHRYTIVAIIAFLLRKGRGVWGAVYVDVYIIANIVWSVVLLIKIITINVRAIFCSTTLKCTIV